MSTFSIDYAARLLNLETMMRGHDWNYASSNDSQHWQRCDATLVLITRESWELRQAGHDGAVSDLWNRYGGAR